MYPPDAVGFIMWLFCGVCAVIIAGLIVWLATVIVQQHLRDRRAGSDTADANPSP